MELRLFDGKAEPYLNNCVLAELEGLSRQNVNAKIALELFRNIKAIDGKGSGDDCILDTCKRHEMCLLSSDKNLLKRATDLNLKTLTLQDGRKIGWQ